MRAVIDTNVLLSGLFWRGAPHALLEQARDGALTLISSPSLLAEFAEVINPRYPRPFQHRSRANARCAAAVG